MDEVQDERRVLSIIGPQAGTPKMNKTGDAALALYTRVVYNFPDHPGSPAMKKAWFFSGPMTADCDGSPRAYKADKDALGVPLDHVGNAHDGADWFGVVTVKDGVPNTNGVGDPYVQTAKRGDPYPGFYVSKTSLQDRSIHDLRDPRRYVDPEKVPFVTLPGSGVHTHVVKGVKTTTITTADGEAHHFNGTTIGDVAYVVSPGTLCGRGAVIADGSPANKAGEGSIRLFQWLGLPNATGSYSPDNRLLFIYFPGSAAQLGWPADEARIDRLALSLFIEWGGMARLKRAFPHPPLDDLRLWVPGL